MARILLLLVVLLCSAALPIFALDTGAFSPKMSMNNSTGLQLQFSPKTVSNARQNNNAFSATLTFPGYDAKPATAGEIPSLLADLQQEDKDVCGKAAARLAISGDQVVKPLADLLTGKNEACQVSAMILFVIGTDDAMNSLRKMPIEPLLADLNSDDNNAKLFAAFFLASIGDRDIVNKLVDILHKDETGEMSVPIMIGMARNSSINTLPIFEDCLMDQNPLIRAFATVIVAGLTGKRAYDKLIPLLGDSDATVHMFSIMALCTCDDKRAIPLAEHALLFEENAGARMFAAMGLSKAHDAKAIPLLLSALKKEQESVVKIAIYGALHELPRTSDSQAALDAARTDPDENVRKMVEAMLEKK